MQEIRAQMDALVEASSSTDPQSQPLRQSAQQSQPMRQSAQQSPLAISNEMGRNSGANNARQSPHTQQQSEHVSNSNDGQRSSPRGRVAQVQDSSHLNRPRSLDVESEQNRRRLSPRNNSRQQRKHRGYSSPRGQEYSPSSHDRYAASPRSTRDPKTRRGYVSRSSPTSPQNRTREDRQARHGAQATSPSSRARGPAGGHSFDHEAESRNLQEFSRDSRRMDDDFNSFRQRWDRSRDQHERVSPHRGANSVHRAAGQYDSRSPSQSRPRSGDPNRTPYSHSPSANARLTAESPMDLSQVTRMRGGGAASQDLSYGHSTGDMTPPPRLPSTQHDPMPAVPAEHFTVQPASRAQGRLVQPHDGDVSRSSKNRLDEELRAAEDAAAQAAASARATAARMDGYAAADRERRRQQAAVQSQAQERLQTEISTHEKYSQQGSNQQMTDATESDQAAAATEAQRVHQEKRRAAAAEAERARQQQERAAAAEAERVRQEQERAAAAEAERARQEQERAAAAEAERVHQERQRAAAAEAERIRQEQDRAAEAERVRQEEEAAAAAAAAEAERLALEEEEALAKNRPSLFSTSALGFLGGGFITSAPRKTGHGARQNADANGPSGTAAVRSSAGASSSVQSPDESELGFQDVEDNSLPMLHSQGNLSSAMLRKKAPGGRRSLFLGGGVSNSSAPLFGGGGSGLGGGIGSMNFGESFGAGGDTDTASSVGLGLDSPSSASRGTPVGDQNAGDSDDFEDLI